MSLLSTRTRSRPVSTCSLDTDDMSINKKLCSAVAVIANRTAYDVRYTIKLSNRFRLQVYERLVRTIRFNG